MTTPTTLRTSLCDDLGIEYPILLAGMGGRGNATPPALVAAVSEAGGMGVIGGAGLAAETVRARIREVRSLTDKPFGVDLLLPASMDEDVVPEREQVRERLKREHPRHVRFVQDLMAEHGLARTEPARYSLSRTEIVQQVDVVLDEKPAVFAAGLGDPSWVVPRAHELGIRVMGLVGNVRNAQRQRDAGVDYVIAQGHEAGGHVGRIANYALLPQVIDAVAPTPVIAAGGIADGRAVAASLAFGAVGAWVGTAFLLAEESRLVHQQQDEIRRGRTEDFVVTRAYTGKPARDYRNPVITRWEESGLEPLSMPLQGILMEEFVSAAQAAGRHDLVNNPAGQIAGALDQIRPARDIFMDLVQGAVDAIERLSTLVQHDART